MGRAKTKREVVALAAAAVGDATSDDVKAKRAAVALAALGVTGDLVVNPHDGPDALESSIALLALAAEGFAHKEPHGPFKGIKFTITDKGRQMLAELNALLAGGGTA